MAMRHDEFSAGLVAGALAMAGAAAVNWFITPARHPDVGAVRTALVAAQLVVGLGGSLRLVVAARRRRALSDGRSDAKPTP